MYIILSMHRTQIYLEEAHYQLLQSRARREGKSMAAVIRGMLDAHLGRGTKSRDAFSQVIGIGKGDGSAVAENYENYLYAEES